MRESPLHDYEHQQPGTLLRVTVGLAVVALGVIAIASLAAGDNRGATWGCVLGTMFAMIFALFHSLTVRVSHNAIAISFGIGIVQKSFVIDDIQTVAIVKNHWYNGWGIRRIRGGWLYNVSGFDAVEIKTKNGRRYRIGTDQPRELLAAIESGIAASS